MAWFTKASNWHLAPSTQEDETSFPWCIKKKKKKKVSQQRFLHARQNQSRRQVERLFSLLLSLLYPPHLFSFFACHSSVDATKKKMWPSLSCHELRSVILDLFYCSQDIHYYPSFPYLIQSLCSVTHLFILFDASYGPERDTSRQYLLLLSRTTGHPRFHSPLSCPSYRSS